MKLKHLPDDFCVEELTPRVPDRGRFALYQLTKRGLGTPEAVAAVARRWRLTPQQISYCGLKDRHALTVQWLAIAGGPPRHLHETNLELHYVGQTDAPLQSDDISANRFRVILRDLSAGEEALSIDCLPGLARDGLPNYFDQQRFGSLGQSRQFIAEAWARRDCERAVWLAMADPNPRDRPETRRQKELLREHWGQWDRLRKELGQSPYVPVVAHLAIHEDDYRRAMARFPIGDRRLWIEAFQSHLWNGVLAAVLRNECAAEQLFDMPLAGQPVPLYRRLDDRQREQLHGLQLPLPAARNRVDEGPMAELINQVAARHGLTQRELRIDYPRDSFFSKGSRAAVFLPAGLCHEAADDECYPGRRKLQIRFDLPRGCYATILIRRLTGAAGGMEPRMNTDEHG